jgi:hypothetical protein
VKRLAFETGNLCKIIGSSSWRMSPFGYNRMKKNPVQIAPESIALVLLIYGTQDDEATGWAQVLIDQDILDVHTDFLEKIDD